MKKTSKRFLVLLSILAVVAGGLFVWYRIAGNSPQALRARADENYKNGQHAEALLQYRMLLGKDPQNAHAYLRAGMIWIERGAPLRAVPFLQQAHRLDPENLEIRRKWATVLLSLGDVRAARQGALDILELAPADPDAVLLLANTSFTDDQVAQARSFLEALDPATDPFYHLANAALLAREGKQEALKSALDRSREIAPTSHQVQLALASYHRAMGDTEAYLAIVAKTSRRDGAGPADLLRYAQALAAAGRTGEAMRLLEDLAAAYEDFLPTFLAMADFHARQENYEEALKSLERVHRVDPANIEGRSIETRVHLAMGEPEKAVEVYENLDRVYPRAPRIKFALSACYLRNGDEVKARATLEAAMKIAPELSRDYAESVMRLAAIELRAGNPAAASKWLSSVVSSRPDLRQAQLLLARAYAADGRLEEAAGIFRESIEEQPDSPLGHFMIGQIYKLQQKTGEAIMSLETALKLAPGDLTITAELVELDIRREDFATAHRRLRHHLDQECPGWGAWLLEGGVFSAAEEWDKAEDSYQKALDLNPQSLAIYDRLIDNYLRAGDPARAIARVEVLAQRQPESLKHRLLLSLLLEQQGEFERAATNYQALLEDSPEFIPALNNLAYLYAVKLEKLEEAESIARKARAIDGSNPALADTLGWILVRRGGEVPLREGLRLLKEAAAGLPDQPEVQYHLGVALSQTGAREESRRALGRAAAAEEDFPGKAEAAGLLASFEGTPDPGQDVTELEALRQNAPFNLPVRLQLGQLYETRGQSEEAIAVHQEALKLDTRNVPALKALARLEQDARPEQARDYARRAWEAAPSDIGTSALQGYWVFRDGRFAQAYTILRSSAETGRDPEVMALFANAAFNTGRIAEARETMGKIPAEAPQHADAQTFLALTADPGAGDRAAMEAVAEAVLESDPAHAPALFVRATRLERDGQTDDAIRQFEDLHRRLPDFHPAAIRLAALYADDPARLDKAEALALEALEKGGNSPELDRVLGEILAREDKSPAAITHLERAGQASPLDAEGLFLLGKSYHEARRPEEARSTLQEALDAGLDESLAARAKELLEAE